MEPRADAPEVLGRPTLSRREFVARAAVAAGVGMVSPFAFVRATAAPRNLVRFVERKHVECRAPGLAAAVVRGNELVWATGAGWADVEREIRATPETVFMLASISKTITAAGVMSVVEDGNLDLDADIDDYLPFDVDIPERPGVRITTRQLLVHTSAIRDRLGVWGSLTSTPTLYFHGDSPLSLGDFLRSYFVPGRKRYDEDGNFYERRPGTRYAYSNLAVALAGYVAECASGKDFATLCKRRLLRPLGMIDSGFRLADISTRNLATPYLLGARGGTRPIYQYGYPDYPDGALRTSAEHLAFWLGAHMNEGARDGVRILERSTVREIVRDQIPDIARWHQGLIWYSIPNPFRLGHTGGDYGVSTRMFYRPKRQVGVIVLTNAGLYGSGWRAIRDIEDRLFHEFA